MSRRPSFPHVIDRPFPTVSLFVMVLLAGGCGCSADRDTEAIIITPLHNEPQLLLLSDVLASEDRNSLIRSEFLMENRLAVPQTIELQGKSCTCYQVLVDGQPLDVESSFAIEPHSARRLRLAVSTPTAAAERTWRSTLRVTHSDVPPSKLTVSATARVIDDARMEPNVIRLSASPSTAEANRTIGFGVRHTWRGEAAASGPRVTGLPEECLVTTVNPDASVTALNEATAPEDRLYERFWRLTVEIPSTVLTEAGLQPLEVSFEGEERPRVVARGRLLVESCRGVIAPNVVHFGQAAIGDSRRRRIVLASDDDRAFQITKWEFDESSSDTDLSRSDTELSQPDADVLVHFDKTATALRYIIEIEWTVDNDGSWRRSLILATDHPRSRRVVIKLQGLGVAVAESPGL